ncbi:hypothetical protein C1H46_024320 [Malus baccata]|uniref:Uncharacterized protein n=1 Tax=Malus baccata TaxID=106549 RepID=A0A540LUR9_MALBA|nr:hypothetical protein C1H46_024320 [Malus baccata]
MSKAKFGTQTSSPDTVSTEAVANTDTLAEADAQKDTPAGSSLLTILRQPSLPSKRCTGGITVDQIESVLASFENGRKSMRANGQVYRRT